MCTEDAGPQPTDLTDRRWQDLSDRRWQDAERPWQSTEEREARGVTPGELASSPPPSQKG
jgi:hypothetical protein